MLFVLYCTCTYSGMTELQIKLHSFNFHCLELRSIKRFEKLKPRCQVIAIFLCRFIFQCGHIISYHLHLHKIKFIQFAGRKNLFYVNKISNKSTMKYEL